MNLNSLPKSSGGGRRKRLGRGHGSGVGKTCGKGHKGQMARSGHKHKPTFEGGQNRLVTSVPIRGFNNHTRVQYIPVNLEALAAFDSGAEVDVAALRASGLARGQKKLPVKILGRGEIDKPLHVKAHGFSASAREKIEKAGGSCEVVPRTAPNAAEIGDAPEVVAEPEPEVAEPEPEATEPEPVAAEPEPEAAEPEATEPEPEAAELEPGAAEAEAAAPEPEPETAAETPDGDAGDAETDEPEDKE